MQLINIRATHFCMEPVSQIWYVMSIHCDFHMNMNFWSSPYHSVNPVCKNTFSLHSTNTFSFDKVVRCVYIFSQNEKDYPAD